MPRILDDLNYVEAGYCDYNSTCPMAPALKNQLTAIAEQFWANPSSQHSLGKRNAHLIANVRRKISSLLDSEKPTATFCGSATEAMNLALNSIAQNREPILYSAVEHSCVGSFLKNEGINAIKISVDKSGIIKQQEIEAALETTKGSVWLVIQAANNETGVVQPIEKMKARFGKKIKILLDASQILGKHPNWIEIIGFADAAIISPHKFYGPKGIGILLHDEDFAVLPMIHGGGQEKNRRSGTENVLAIALLNEWLKTLQSLEEAYKAVQTERAEFESELKRLNGNIEIVGGASERLANTSSVFIPNVSSEALLVRLDAAEWAISTGSACHSGAIEPSHVYLSYGYNWEQAKEIIRVSFGLGNEIGAGKKLAHFLSHQIAEILHIDSKRAETSKTL